MDNDYYRKHKSERRVVLNMRDRIVIQTLLAMEIAFNELNKNTKPAFSVEHMKKLYEKISERNYDETHRKE